MNRRGFLSSIIALGAAPAIVRADSLMRVIQREDLFCAEYTWTQASLVVVPTNDEFANLVAETFKKHREQIIKNIEARNALLQKYLREQMYAKD